jgi:surface antigen
LTLKTKAMLGVVTTMVFVVLGMTLVAAGNTKVGAVLMALGLLRGSVAGRQITILLDEGDDRSGIP